MIKVLMIGRSTLYSTRGGDTTQVEMTARYLKLLGVSIDIKLANDNNIDYATYSLVHFFNIFRPDDILPHVYKLKVPFVVSTIFVDYWEFDRKNRKGIAGILSNILNRDQLEIFKTIARSFKNGEKLKSIDYVMMGHKKSIKFIAERADLLLPNSHNEYMRLKKVYSLDQPYIKIVNAVDTNTFNTQVEPNTMFAGQVLCVGRIEGPKNQLNLIKAISGTNLKLTIIGNPSPNHLNYYRECVKLAGTAKNVRLINSIDHKVLSTIYKAAKVHILPSWFETTGLSSLEAGVMGCNLVITKKGDTEEYFKDMAYYCEPDNVESIRDAVLTAYNAPVNPTLQQYIINNYTWEKTAEQTLNAYKSVLDN